MQYVQQPSSQQLNSCPICSTCAKKKICVSVCNSCATCTLNIDMLILCKKAGCILYNFCNLWKWYTLYNLCNSANWLYFVHLSAFVQSAQPLQYINCTEECALCNNPVCCVQSALCCVQYPVYCVQCAICCVQCAVCWAPPCGHSCLTHCYWQHPSPPPPIITVITIAIITMPINRKS